MIIESIIPIDKIKKEVDSEGVLSPAGLVLTRYNKVKECPSIANIQDLFNFYMEWKNSQCTCFLCGADIPQHFVRLVMTANLKSSKKILNTCIKHEGSHILRYVLKTLEQGGLIA